jgi:hypothetical protein
MLLLEEQKNESIEQNGTEYTHMYIDHRSLIKGQRKYSSIEIFSINDAATTGHTYAEINVDTDSTYSTKINLKWITDPEIKMQDYNTSR